MLTRVKDHKGFTLLELIVVLVVIGILAAIAIPSYSAVKRNSAESAVVQNAEAIARNANAIAASTVPNATGTTSAAHLKIAADESADAGGDTFYGAGIAIATVRGGGACFQAAVTLTGGLAVVNDAADCES